MFNVGDSIKVVNNDGSYQYSVGEVCTVNHVESQGFDHEYINVVGKEDGMFAFRFKLHKEKQMKLKDIIKPFMRVRTRSEGMWIAVEKDGECFLVQGNGFNHILECGEYGEDEHSVAYDIMEVFEAPNFVGGYLNSDEHGESVWKLPITKTPQQIAIEDLEESIKDSQSKLEELKRTL